MHLRTERQLTKHLKVHKVLILHVGQGAGLPGMAPIGRLKQPCLGVQHGSHHAVQPISAHSRPYTALVCKFRKRFIVPPDGGAVLQADQGKFLTMTMIVKT